MKYKDSKFRESGAMNESQTAKTKVVIRHLPPALTQSTLMDKIDSVFAGRYDWFLFRPGKQGPKNQSYCTAYINFKRPDDVIEFAGFFNGHVFVNEKGSQLKALVEYAPSQRLPKDWNKKDSREGTIYTDPDYLEFLEFIAKPVENLPSAEIQLERREAEKSGGSKDAPIVTPLMDFVRQKRAARSESRRILSNGKISRRAGTSGSPSSSSSSKRGSEKKRNSTMYVMRETVKGAKDRPSNVVIAKRDDKKLVEKAFPEASDSVKKKIILVKGKEKEILNNQRQDPTGRIVKSLLINSDRTSTDQAAHHVVVEKRPPRPPVASTDVNGISGNELTAQNDKERRIKSRDRSDNVIWTPLRRSDGSYSSEESFTSIQSFPEGFNAEVKGDVRIITGGRVSQSLFDNGMSKQFARRGPPHALKDSETQISEGKPLKRGGNPNFEKQVWVQKSSSG